MVVRVLLVVEEEGITCEIIKFQIGNNSLRMCHGVTWWVGEYLHSGGMGDYLRRWYSRVLECYIEVIRSQNKSGLKTIEELP